MNPHQQQDPLQHATQRVLAQMLREDPETDLVLRRTRGLQKDPSYLISLRILLLQRAVRTAQREIEELKGGLRRNAWILDASAADSVETKFLFGGIVQVPDGEPDVKTTGESRIDDNSSTGRTAPAAGPCLVRPDGDSWAPLAA
jgi:hypothetical protein